MAFTSSGQVENSGSGTITALDGAVAFNIPTSSSLAFQITGTWVATLSFEASVDGLSFFSVEATKLSTKGPVSSSTTNDAFLAGVGGYQAFRIRASAYTSGTATVIWNADNTPNIQSTVQQGNPPWSIIGAVDSSPITSAKFRTVFAAPAQVITGGSYVSIFSYSGSGQFVGAVVNSNQDGFQLRVVIDGTEVIVTDISGTQLNGAGLTAANGSTILYRVSAGVVSFTPPNPIPYSSSIQILGKRDSGANVTIDSYIVHLTKET